MFKNDQRFNIRSAGLSAQSEVQINEKLINWSDLILVMENSQRNRIQKEFRELEIPPIHALDIADDYEYLDKELMEMLDFRINSILKEVMDI